MGLDYQIHRTSVDAAKGYRQFLKADDKLNHGDVDSAVRHYDKGLKLFTHALTHLEKAEEDQYRKAGSEIDKGNKELQKSIDEWGEGKLDDAAKHYGAALDRYDSALDMLD